MFSFRSLVGACALAFGAAGTSMAWADEVLVFAAGASKVAVEQLAPAFQRQTGHNLVVRSDTVGALRDRISQGERPALTVLSQVAVDTLVTQGLVQAAQTVPVGVVRAGLAVKRGAPVPDISNVEALKNTLLHAKNVAHADGARGATSGANFAKMIDQLGLRSALQAKLVILPFGVEVIDGVAAGQYELGASQSSEIVPHASVTYVGDLPAPYALRTAYVAAVVAGHTLGTRLLQFMASPEGLAAFTASGFAPERKTP
jgi:molybdate transport system substrate-binding protein